RFRWRSASKIRRSFYCSLLGRWASDTRWSCCSAVIPSTEGRRLGLHNGRRSMCDYSLYNVRSRPAKVGDKLVTTQFPNTITRGFCDPSQPRVAVCLLPGTELAYEKEVECEARFLFARKSTHKVARFRQVNLNRLAAHHDALEFPDGKIVLVTDLCEGQHATVLQLPSTGQPATEPGEQVTLVPERASLIA